MVVSCAFGLCRKSNGAVIAQAEAIKTQSDPLLIGPQINVCLGDKLDSFLFRNGSCMHRGNNESKPKSLGSRRIRVVCLPVIWQINSMAEYGTIASSRQVPFCGCVVHPNSCLVSSVLYSSEVTPCMQEPGQQLQQ